MEPIKEEDYDEGSNVYAQDNLDKVQDLENTIRVGLRHSPLRLNFVDL